MSRITENNQSYTMPFKLLSDNEFSKEFSSINTESQEFINGFT